jgi:hypothetical protein
MVQVNVPDKVLSVPDDAQLGAGLGQTPSASAGVPEPHGQSTARRRNDGTASARNLVSSILFIRVFPHR